VCDDQIEGNISYLESLVAKGREIHSLTTLLQLFQVFRDVVSFSSVSVAQFALIYE